MSRLKPFENIRRIYFVAVHKLILNVSKIRLRLICARASYLHRLFSKAPEILKGIYFSPEPSRRIRTDREVRGSKQYRVRIANSQTTTAKGGTVVVVPAGIFYALLVSASSISKRLFRIAMDGGDPTQQRRFCSAKTRHQKDINSS